MNVRAEFANLLAEPREQPDLTAEQWTHVDELARSLRPEQARWISSYFAGLEAGLLRGGGTVLTPVQAPNSRTLTILYGSETGNGRDLAKKLAATATERGLAPKVADMAAYKVRQIKDEQDLWIIVSTHGEGDPPEPAVAFFEYIESARAPKLSGLRYSVLALGDSTYEQYCEAGKRLDRRLEELGAQRISGRVDCDVDYDDPAGQWSGTLVEQLSADLETAPDRVISLRPAAASAKVHDKSNPFPATVLENIRIVGRHSGKETRHVELDLTGSGLAYQPGDSLGFVPRNDPTVVEQLLETSGLAADADVVVKGETVPLVGALASGFEITCPSPRFIEQWARLSESAELQALAAAGTAERLGFLEQHHVADIIRRFPVAGIKPDELIAGLRPLQPRLYSIASSQAAVGEEAHLTIAPVRYELHGTARGGVASTHIADRLEMGETVPVYVQENPYFRLPADEVPIIMIGPGTGVAPFRAFLQEREARVASGRSWLFFGERNRRSDFLYQVEWQQWLKDGVLSRLDVAFSRDSAEKVYVQHRLLEQARELYRWLEEGAHLYVCGDEKNMSRDVHEALIQVIGREGDLSWEEAEDYLRRLSAEHRYQKDVY